MNQQPVEFCNGCGKILDEIQPASPPRQWIEARSFLVKYGFTWDDLRLQQNFCPECRKVATAIKPDTSPRANSKAMP
ncbi:MAG: hypothetical protein CV089_00620 [Nitrospira sp. WS110]|nr:hypothetical protein [Nitrospira sp. WS110]